MEFNFKSGIVKSGAKVVDESKPLLYVTSTFNGLRLNKKAMSALGVTVGERVVLFDMKGKASDCNNRFYICSDFEVGGVSQGSKITGNQTFNYSVVYGAILAQDMDVISITPESLIEKGLIYPKNEDSKGQYVATKIGNATLVAVNDGEPVEVTDGVERVVYQLTDFQFAEHAQRTSTEDDDAPEME